MRNSRANVAFAEQIAAAIHGEVEEAIAWAKDLVHMRNVAEIARQYTDCRSCQAGLESYLLRQQQETPPAQLANHLVNWEDCEDCKMDKLAEEYEIASLGAGYIHAINGDDQRWQNGSEVR